MHGFVSTAEARLSNDALDDRLITEIKTTLTKKYRMETVDVWDQQRRREHEQEEVADENVGAPERQLNDLHDELACGLR